MKKSLLTLGAMLLALLTLSLIYITATSFVFGQLVVAVVSLIITLFSVFLTLSWVYYIHTQC